MDLRACIVCGGEFPKRHRAKICSDACLEARRLHYQAKALKPKAERQCPRCGTAFTTGLSTKRHCSNKCKDAMRKGNKPPRRKGPALTKAQEHAKYKEKDPERFYALRRAQELRRKGRRPKAKSTVSPERREAIAARNQWRALNARALLLKRRAKAAHIAMVRKAARDNPRKRGQAASTLLLKAVPDAYAKALTKWRAKSLKRKTGQTMQDDGTATTVMLIGGKRCLYCDVALHDGNRTADHMNPLTLGGVHSASNLAPCCHSCNSGKSAIPFAEYVTRINEPMRSKAIAYYEKRNGPMVQAGIAFTFAQSDATQQRRRSVR